jgi:hypothetical protein
MSAQGLQHVVCRGAIDRSFLSELAALPERALAGFDLDNDERTLLIEMAPHNLTELARGIEAWRKGTSVPAEVRRSLAHTARRS